MFTIVYNIIIGTCKPSDWLNPIYRHLYKRRMFTVFSYRYVQTPLKPRPVRTVMPYVHRHRNINNTY